MFPVMDTLLGHVTTKINRLLSCSGQHQGYLENVYMIRNGNWHSAEIIQELVNFHTNHFKLLLHSSYPPHNL